MNSTKNIIFVSCINPISNKSTSTDIMTLNILKGFKENDVNVVFFAISESREFDEDINTCFGKYVDELIVLPGQFKTRISKYARMTKMLCCSIDISFYKKIFMKLISKIKCKPDLIISHSPSVESIYYSTVIKKHFNIPWYQYWSDPIALSGIIPDKMNIKRLPFKYIENNALKKSDRIIYGTRTLADFQKKMYPGLKSRMYYVDVAYINSKNEYQPKKNKRILYAGNYYKKIRNIQPLIDAIEGLEEYTLDIYGSGDVYKYGYKHCFFYNRVSPEELAEIQNDYEYLVCVLNHSCIQIPGKIFYDISKNIKIIIITDGIYGDELCEYLEKYKRFNICGNNVDDIKICILKSDSCNFDLRYIYSMFSTKKIAGDILDGGKNNSCYQ